MISPITIAHKMQRQGTLQRAKHSLILYTIYALHFSGSIIGFAGCGGLFGSPSNAGPFRFDPAGLARAFARGNTWQNTVVSNIINTLVDLNKLAGETPSFNFMKNFGTQIRDVRILGYG